MKNLINEKISLLRFFFVGYIYFLSRKHSGTLFKKKCYFVNVSWQRSYWFRFPLTNQLKRDSVGHGEATINNARIIAAYSCVLSIYLYILPYALADILGRLAHRLLVADRKKRGL